MARITAPPNILGGKPIIAGTRISVEFILQLLASGMTEAKILLDYPHLHPADIHACLSYAANSLWVMKVSGLAMESQNPVWDSTAT